MRALLTILLIVTLQSCSTLTKKEEPEKGDPVARVHERVLYAEDIVNVVPAGTSKEDSVQIVKNYIDNWIRQTLLITKAEENLRTQQKEFEKQLEDYRQSLLIHRYQSELISQNLDTVVTDQEIENYYKENQDNFQLKNNIIKVVYVKVNKKAPKIEKLRQWYKSDRPEDMKALESYCFQFAENYMLDDKSWLLFDDLLKEVPIESYNQEEFLKQNRFVELEDSSSYYFLNIKGFRIKNSTSPLSFEKENIRNLILNKRKIEFISNMKNDLYQQALKNNDFEIYK